jgi:hypothetical protein
MAAADGGSAKELRVSVFRMVPFTWLNYTGMAGIGRKEFKIKHVL